MMSMSAHKRVALVLNGGALVMNAILAVVHVFEHDQGALIVSMLGIVIAMLAILFLTRSPNP